ncbi:fumarylacetoacetate hydrolase family protein [Reinekea sp.]|jgi:2-keto-4-pentenoate hydratase/2-oxohepta-3-ene-1,7-dioic acid hydratase in catechol pathway|uniref:fumarylacetoacetate hydrolase family protein n=1 Tax=Reinekea sp. TaxID=1970455 RepID=UPI003988B135
MNAVSFLSKPIYPSKIVCIGRNYVEHIQELGNEIPDEMVVFVKPNSAIGDQPKTQKKSIHYEAELSFLVKNGRFVGVGIGLDLTKRDLQTKLRNKGLPWERAKSFDDSAVFSSFVALPEQIGALSFELTINGGSIQQGDISLMMYKPDVILHEVQQFMTLTDGDIVMTGTPKGVGELKRGDLYQAEVRYQGQVIVSKEWQVA